jgi:hypothetical protein
MTEQAISPMRRRMIEDMTIRKFAQKTQHDYVQRVKDFASYLKRSPDLLRPSSPSQPIPSISAPASACSLCFTPGVRHSPTPT